MKKKKRELKRVAVFTRMKRVPGNELFETRVKTIVCFRFRERMLLLTFNTHVSVRGEHLPSIVLDLARVYAGVPEVHLVDLATTTTACGVRPLNF